MRQGLFYAEKGAANCVNNFYIFFAFYLYKVERIFCACFQVKTLIIKHIHRLVE